MIFLYLLIAVIPLENAASFSSLTGLASITKLVGFVCILAALIRMAMTQRSPNLLQSLQAKLMVALLVIVTVSGSVSGHILDLRLNNAVSYYSFFAFLFVLLMLVDSERRLNWLFLVLVISMAIASSYGVREYIWGLRHYGPDYRPNAVTGDVNYFGINCLLTLPIAILLFRRSDKSKFLYRVFLLGCVGLITLELLVGASRGAFLGSVGMFLFIVRFSRHKIRYFALLTVFVIPFLLISPTSPLRRLVLGSHGDVQSVESRIVSWHAGLRMVLHHPLMGVGLDAYKQVEVDYDSTGILKMHPHIAHNAYLEIGAELGLPALLIFLLILGSTFRTLSVVRRRARRYGFHSLADVSLAMHTGLVGACIGIVFVSGQYQKILWLFIWLSVCLRALVAKARAKQLRDQEQPGAAEQQPGEVAVPETTSYSFGGDLLPTSLGPAS